MSEILSCSVTRTQLAAIDALVERTGQTRTEWLQQVIDAALSETPSNIRNLTERVAALELAQAKIAAVAQTIEALTQPIALTRFPPDEKTASPSTDQSSESQSVTPSSDPSPSAFPIASTSGAETGSWPASSQDTALDDDEDEPDEILYDFLEPQSSGMPSPSSGYPQSSAHPTQTTAEPSIYDAEDEPDEILYDFLDPQD